MSIEIEYTICLVQSGDISLAAKTHRLRDGDPRLEVDISPKLVNWRLLNLISKVVEKGLTSALHK